MNWNINAIVPFITFFLYGGLLFVVSTSQPQTESRRSFRWFMLSMAVYSLSGFLLLVNTQHVLIWMRLFAASSIPPMISLFYFTQTFIEEKIRWSRIVIYYGLVAIILCLSTDLVVTSAYIENGAVHYEFGDAFLLISGPSYLLVIYSIYLLIRNFRLTLDVNRRNRLLYLIVALSLIPAMSLVNFTPLGKYPLDIAGYGVTALLIAYTILRYHLLDIRIVIRQGLLYSIPTIIIGTTYFLIITALLKLFERSTGVEVFITSLAVAVITALIAEPLRVKAQSFIDQLFFREKYDSTLMLQTLSGRVGTELDIYKVTTMILEEVCSTLHITSAAFFLRDQITSRFQLVTQVGHSDIQNIEFRHGHPIILWLVAHEQPLTRHDMEVLPQFQSLWQSELQDLDTLSAELFIPIKVYENLIGVFLVGSKRSEQAYTMEDVRTLSTVANQTAVAIENARLYTSEQNRLKEMDTLYSMARRLVATDKLEDVLATVAQHAAESIEAAYARILLREENGDYSLQAVYPANMLSSPDRVDRKEPLVAEYYYNWILQRGEAVVVFRDDPSLHEEEKAVLFSKDARSVCLSPLKGAEQNIGLLILGDDQHNHMESFPITKVRLINVISDYATSAIQRAMLLNRLEESFLQTVISLANAMDARDTYTGDHSQRMAALAFRMGEAMKLPPEEVEMLHWAAILHDIGKIGVPDEILNKEGPLTKEEWVIMKEHPVIGAQIVEPVKYLSPVSPLIRAHHEKYDGTGYPYGLQGEDIPLGSRILAVVDAYVAIRDERVYSKSHTHEEAIAELRRFSGTQFDPRIVDVFCNLVSNH